MRASVILLLALAACSRPKQDEPSPPIVTPAQATASTPVAPSSAAVAVHLAIFGEDGDLDTCVSMTITATPDGPAPVDEAAFRERVEAIELPGTALTKPCLEQFLGRLVLATCEESEATRGATGTVTMDSTTRYYAFGTALDDDDQMRECLQRGGDWQSLAEDSLEYQRAKAEWDLARLRRRLDR